MITDHRIHQRLSALACSLLLSSVTSSGLLQAQQGAVTPPNPVEQIDPFSPPRPPAPALPEVPGKAGQGTPARQAVPRSIRAVSVPPSRGERVDGPTRLSADQQRQVESMTRLGRQLADESLDAFRRGLAPLEDFAEMQSAAISLQRTVSRVTGREGDLAAALDRQARQMSMAADELKELRQPGAWNYDADRTLSELLTLDARRSLAELRGDRRDMGRLLGRRGALARENWELRKEYVSAGMSDFFQLGQAAELMSARGSSSEKPTAETIAGWAAFRPQLAEMVQAVERLGGAAESFNGAGLGRPDQVALARYSLSALDCRLAVARDDAPAARTAMQTALDASREAFALQADYQSTGTATVYDLARTLRMRADLLSEPGIRPAEGLEQELSADLRSVVRLADQTDDTRGRRAADVSFVQAVAARETARGWLKR